MSEELNRKVDEALANMRAPFGTKEASWERLSAKINAEEQVTRWSIRPLWIGAAASIALAIGVFTFLSSDQAVFIETAMAQHEQVTLPDGSVVTLNADSRLSYNASTFDTDRTLTLDGEAFFEVQKGSKFQVETDKGTITVLGTSFNICDRDALLEVACVTGKVAVDNGNSRTILTPGLACDNKQGAISAAFASEGSDGWRSGAYSFVEDDLAFVMSEVGRQFGVEMNTPDLSGMLFTGDFTSHDLETTLTVICTPMGLDYSIDESTIHITKK